MNRVVAALATTVVCVSLSMAVCLADAEESKPLWKSRVQATPSTADSGEANASAINASVHRAAMMLNNQAVLAINKKQYLNAIGLLTNALSVDRNYALARENMAIANKYYGIQLIDMGESDKALRPLRESIFFSSSYPYKWPLQELDGILSGKGIDPKDPTARTMLGDEAKALGKYRSAAAEYLVSLELKNDPAVHKKLSEAYTLMHLPEQAAVELEKSNLQ